MYTDCQLEDFKLNSDLMKSMLLGFCFVFKDCSNSPPAEWTARAQKYKGTWNNSESIVVRKDLWVFKLEGMQM